MCMWTEGLAGQVLEMPSAHGEGRPLFCAAGTAIDARGVSTMAMSTAARRMDYPANPNGSPRAVAGIS